MPLTGRRLSVKHRLRLGVGVYLVGAEVSAVLNAERLVVHPASRAERACPRSEARAWDDDTPPGASSRREDGGQGLMMFSALPYRVRLTAGGNGWFRKGL